MTTQAATVKNTNDLTVVLGLLLQRARKLCRQQLFQRALGMLAPLVQDHPQHLDLLKMYGSCLQLSGATRNAVATYRRALAIAPDEIDVLTNLGEVLLSCLDLRGASEALGRAIALDPHYENPSAQRARALVAQVVCACADRGLERI